MYTWKPFTICGYSLYIKKKKKVQVSKAIAQSSFQNAKNVFVKPLECLMSGFTSSFTSSLFQ